MVPTSISLLKKLYLPLINTDGEISQLQCIVLLKELCKIVFFGIGRILAKIC